MQVLLCLGCRLNQRPDTIRHHCDALDCNWWICSRCGAISQRGSHLFIKGNRMWSDDA